MSFDEKPDDESFDAAILAYAEACRHWNRSGMREGYIKLRAMCSPAPQEAPAETPDAGPVAWIADEELKRLKENGRIWVVADLWAVQQDYDSVGKTFTQIPLYLHPAPSDAQALRKALEQLVRLEDMRLRLHKAQESGHGTDYDLYRDNLSAAWYDAHAALGGGK